ncbi:MAG: glucokinase [Candidatus Marinimicrobia bacterium]|nr:glucokinase [Candidatus Neomarinimicrobiota bacterium]|tara:strand:- start:4597 stop:5568 length:972 start_codon:yes stop_codon:yes gene_type:complete
MNYAIGIDIGGTNTVLGLVDNNGSILDKETFSTKNKNQEEFFSAAFNNVSELIRRNPRNKPDGIGIGAPNANHYSGIIHNPPNLDIGCAHIPTIASQYTDLKIFLTNDANAAALGEKMFGKAQNMDNFVLITLGTGLGSGMFVNGKLLIGHKGYAGEMGHIIIDYNGRECNCGKKGCLEMYVSAKGITETVKEFQKELPDDPLINNLIDNSLKDMQLGLSHIDGRLIDKAFDNKNQTACNIYNFTSQKLGQGLAQVATMLEPEAFIFYGGFANAGNRILEKAKENMNDNLMDFQKGKIEVMLSELPEGGAGILGAASLVFNTL